MCTVLVSPICTLDPLSGPRKEQRWAGPPGLTAKGMGQKGRVWVPATTGRTNGETQRDAPDIRPEEAEKPLERLSASKMSGKQPARSMLKAGGWTCPPEGPAGPEPRAGGFTDGVLWGCPRPFSGSFANTHSVSQLPGFRIFIQKQGLKKLYRVSAAESSALPRGTPPAAWQCPLLGWPSAKPSQSIPVKGLSVEAAGICREVGREAWPPAPPPSPPP